MKTNQINWKNLMNVAALGAVALSPIFGVVGESQAQVGYRYGQTQRAYRTLEGVVTNDNNRGGRDFTMRLDNGQSVAVRLDEREPRRLSVRDRVRVYGYFIGNRFEATNLSILNDRNGRNDINSRAYRTLVGVVTRDIDDRNRRDFVMRLGNGQNVAVRLEREEPRRLSEGDRVRVFGRYINNRFEARSIEILRDNDNGYYTNQNRTLVGTVTDVVTGQRFRLNADGRIYDVTSYSSLPRGLSRGDRVSVYGRIDGNNVTGASVRIVNNYGTQYGTQGSRITFTGTVLGINERDNTFSVRRDNGTTLTVRARDDVDILRRGNRVRVTGRLDGSMVYAEGIDRL